MKGTTTRSRPVCGGVLRVSPFLRTSLRIIHVWLRIHAVDGETRRPDGTPGIDGKRRRISESGQRAGQIAPSRMHRDERLTYLTCDRYKKLRIPVVSYKNRGLTHSTPISVSFTQEGGGLRATTMVVCPGEPVTEDVRVERRSPCPVPSRE